MRFEIASQGIGVLLSDFAATIVDNTGYPIPIESQPLQLTAVGKRSAPDYRKHTDRLQYRRKPRD